MHIVGNLLSLSLSLSQISSRSSDGQHSQPCHLGEQWQLQCQPASTANTGASIDHASTDAANHATNYVKHAAGTRTTTSTTTLAAQQAWRILADEASHILSLRWTNGCRRLVKGHWEETTSCAMHQQRKGSIRSTPVGWSHCRLVGCVCWSPWGARNYQLPGIQEQL
jgi:hypothetical protein